MKTFSVKKIALTVGLAGLASQAMAVPLEYNNIDEGGNDPVDVEILVSGASASDKQFKALFNDLCTNEVVTFTDRCADSGDDSVCTNSGPKIPGKSYTAYFCTMDDTTVNGLSGSKNVLFRKRSAGGSFWGTTPVAEATNVKQMVLDDANCNATVADPTIFKCDKTVEVDTISDAGVSDEEPSLFVSPNVASGQSAISPAALANLNVAATSALTFGVPVTNALYAALQQAQGFNPDLDGDLAFEGTSENVSEELILANMPSLTKEQVAALIKGDISSWSKVHYPVAGVSTPLTTIASNAPSTANVSICRRVNGSGTQAQMNANFLHVPCTSSTLPAGDNTICTKEKGQENEDFGPSACEGGDGYDGYAELTGVDLSKAIVHENSGSGDVTECLDQLDGANFWALGVQSLEKASSNWSFIKLNGVEPTLAKVASGEYFDWAATTMQWRNNTTNGVLPPSGDQLAILEQVRSNAGNPTIADGINDGVSQGFGPTGILALSTTAGVTVHPFDPNAPVMQYSRAGKTCGVQNATGGNVDFAL